jgi:hypothetical protein
MVNAISTNSVQQHHVDKQKYTLVFIPNACVMLTHVDVKIIDFN